MGGRGRSRTQRKHFRQSRENEQQIVSPEEWDTFIKYLRTPLPAAFRINSSSQFYMYIRLKLKNDFTISLQAEDIDGSEVVAIKPLPWYPSNLASHSNFSRNQLRKNQTLESDSEKTVSLLRKMDSSNAQAAMSKEVKEDSDGVEIDSTEGTEETTIDADTLENGTGEDALDTDSNIYMTRPKSP